MAHGLADVARAFVDAHAFAVRANVDDLERAVGGEVVERVLVTGGEPRSDEADERRYLAVFEARQAHLQPEACAG